jgi:parvulin-like peptidyl-prolyl isomerase
MNFPRLTLPLVIVFAFLSGGCHSTVPPNDVVLTVNGQTIREPQVIAEADQRINANNARDRRKGLIFEESARPAMRDFLRDDALNTLIERVLIAQQLRADGLEVTEAEVEARFLENVQRFNQTPATAEQEILTQGKTLRSVKERLRWQTLGIEKLYERHAPEKPVLTEAEALQMYTDYPREFDRPEERRVSHILIRVASDAESATRQAARTRAEGLLQRLRAGEKFETLAQNYSDDELSSDQGGDRGYSDRGIITSPTDDPFGNAAFALKSLGEISDVVETRDGFHIIKLTGLKEARHLSFAEVKAALITDFRHREIGRFWETFGGDLRRRAKLEWSADELTRQRLAAARQRELNQRIEQEIAAQQQSEAAARAQ